MKTSIRSKVIKVNSAIIVLSILIMTIFVVIIVQKQIASQVFNLLKSNVYFIHSHMEQRISYLVENTILLTTNELMINALTDAEGRQVYLPKLVDNFMEGKDVISLNVVDFDGRPIFQTQANIPTYHDSSQLRAALAYGNHTIYVQHKEHQLVVVAPIKYYETTQGAVVVVFDIRAIARRNHPQEEDSYMKLLFNGQTIYSFNYDETVDYQSYIHQADETLPYLSKLGISLELGVPYTRYFAPITQTVLILAILGLMLTGIGVFVAFKLAAAMTQPILTLHERVKASNEDNEILCSPLGTQDELEDLAEAFDERTLKLQYQAEHDALTELPNRVLFIDRLHQAIKSAKRHQNNIAVVFIDLDRFKEVNDSFGHDFGDRFLKLVSSQIAGAIRSNDSVARIGGDEFLLLLTDVNNEKLIIDVIQKLMNLFREPFVLEHHHFFITASLGIALYPQNGRDADELIKNADAAMYKAKDEGRNTYCFYTDDMTQKAIERVTLETQLRQAITNEEFEVFYQLQVDMRTRRIIGMESLIRWKHPEEGYIPPYRFIPLAEELGMIVEIDRWVMVTAMKQFARWIKQGVNPGTLSLNLSMSQLNHEDFIDAVKIAIFDSGIHPHQVMFEITETQIMRNPEQAIIMLNNLKALGVRLAIDDFGTGHSSLSYLKRLPVDKIKIDQSFVHDIPHDKDDIELTRAIIALSNSLNLELIAEGVETEAQAAFLQENGCYEAQGYFYFKPEPLETVDQALSAHA